MLTSVPMTARTSESPLGRTSPVLKLAVAVLWLVGLATTTDPRPALFLAAVALLAGVFAGGITPPRLLTGIGPLLAAAFGIAAINLVFGVANTDPNAAELLRVGPLRVTEPALAAATGLFVRVIAIVAVGAVFTLTTDPTRLVDSLVQQLHVPSRFAYGALAAYQAVPRLGEDLQSLRATRQLRGLGTSWHPRILVGLLVRAIRHADQLAIAMDARGFGARRPTFFRPIAWGPLDLKVGVAGAALVVAALWVVR
jgi:energy-coupling factor transport system permease protein